MRRGSQLPDRKVVAAVVVVALLAPRPLRGAEEGSPGELAALRALEATARERRLTPRELLELGWLRARRGLGEPAGHAFLAAALDAKDPSVAAIAHHDAGVLALERGDLVRARDHFFDALAAEPGREKTQFDLEWTLAALDASAEQPAPTDAPAPPEPGRPRPEEEREEETPPPLPPTSDPETRPERDRPEAGEASRTDASPPPLDEAARERWLGRVRDDPARALRAAAAALGDGERGARRSRPAW